MKYSELKIISDIINYYSTFVLNKVTPPVQNHYENQIPITYITNNNFLWAKLGGKTNPNKKNDVYRRSRSKRIYNRNRFLRIPNHKQGINSQRKL